MTQEEFELSVAHMMETAQHHYKKYNFLACKLCLSIT